FEQALEKFKADLKPKDRTKFSNTTREDVVEEIRLLQQAQNSSRTLKALNRLRPILEALDEIGKVVETFTNSSEFVAYVWGPMKFVLQVASAFAEDFTGLLDVYEDLGERMPMLQQYEQLFKHDGNMKRVLVYLYKDILEFHARALKYFQQKSSQGIYLVPLCVLFHDVIGDIHRHCHLIESQATLAEIQASLREREAQDGHRRKMQDSENIWRLREIFRWLRAVNVENDQHDYANIRAECPGTGQWLLDNVTFKDWFQPLCLAIPPLLWLNGIPGAGKTILASIVIEEAKKLGTCPTTLYFYCKHGDSERDNFISIGRSLLSQLLGGNKDILLDYYWDKYSSSTEAVLSTQSTIEDLLDLTIKNCPSVYIILDGIDECPRKERETISRWFRNLVEGLDVSHPDQVRCLFVSQDDGIARKDFAGLTALKIRNEDIKQDIGKYSSKRVGDIQKKFAISDSRRDEIAAKIQESAGGMFLLAKLISTNLLHQTSVAGLDGELEEGVFPKEINAAYSRIVARIFEQASEAQQRDSRMLLGWLVCAKRALRWHEIQGAKSIHIETQSVDLERHCFRVDSKDLCGSLVEIRSDGTVEFVHMTAKLYKHVNPSRVEAKLASLCIDYLNLPGFRGNPGDVADLVRRGYYGWMDYAVCYWVRHLEAGLVSPERDDEAIGELAESLDAFLSLHYTSPTKSFSVSQGNVSRLQCFKDMECYSKLQQAVISTRKQLTFPGETKAAEIALDLADVVAEIRRALEEAVAQAALANDNEAAQKLEQMYGSNLFRCPRFSCRYFSNGFENLRQREQHYSKHQRPFLCTVSGCHSSVIGLSSAKDLEKHMESHRREQKWEDDAEFPEEEEIQKALQAEQAGQQGQQNQPQMEAENVDATDPEHQHQQQQQQPQQPQPSTHDPKPAEQVHLSQMRKPKQKPELKCEHCGKIFKRKFNLTSHLLTHSTDRPWECGFCDKTFARESDCTRHSKGHSNEGRFVCSGTLKDGQTWGCGKAFARRDTLANHHKSQTGQRCIAPMLME
ncbi:hypothetical protein QBC46DRAFT_419250, partial [Diplogelasinospora grovesii]